MRLLRLTAGTLWLACACSGGGTTAPGTTTGGGGGGGGAGSTSNAITVGNSFFSPSTTTVTVGTTVTWTWNSAGQSHSVTFDVGGITSPTQGSGTYQRTFSAPGTYGYTCIIHGSSMSGTVIVN